MKDKIVIINLSPQVDKRLISVIKKELRSGKELLIITKSFDNSSLCELIKPAQARNIEEFITEDDYQRIDFQIKDFVERLPSSDGNSIDIYSATAGSSEAYRISEPYYGN